MFRRGFPSSRGFLLSLLLALAVFAASLGIDFHAVLSAGRAPDQPSRSHAAFPLPGPRRYPPAYHRQNP